MVSDDYPDRQWRMLTEGVLDFVTFSTKDDAMNAAFIGDWTTYEMIEQRLKNKKSQEARNLAAKLHKDQTNQAGELYIDHLGAVAKFLVSRFKDATDAEIQAAWLHDAIENGGANEKELASAGIDPEAIDIIKQLTRPEESSYLEWIKELILNGSKSAIRVKLADNRDNHEINRDGKTPHDAALIATRYEPTRLMLEIGLHMKQELT